MLLDPFRKGIPFIPYVNTGTMFDIATGRYRPDTRNGWILDGGLPPCLGLTGRGQTYKSGTAGSFLSRALNIHRTAEGYVLETEGNISGAERYDDFVDADTPVSDRILFKNMTTTNLTSFYDEFDAIATEKMKHQKDYTFESEFLDTKSGKAHRIWIPTFLLVDSFSRARSDKGDKQYEDNSIDDAAMNTVWMAEGNIKTRIMNDLPTRAAKSGIYVIMTAHVGNKIDMDPYNKSPKQLQYMKNTDKMKNVGSGFEFLTTALLQTIKAQVLQDKDKRCEYPSEFSTDVEVNQVDAMVVRCKNNASGSIIPFVVSQYQGILDSVTDFIFLKNYNYFGLDIQGNKQSFNSVLTPGKTFTKKTLRNLTGKDYQMKRGLELIAQLCLIQQLWSTFRLPNFINIKPARLAEVFNKMEQPDIDRILNSTGVWSSSTMDRERLTLLDILQYLDMKFPVLTK